MYFFLYIIEITALWNFKYYIYKYNLYYNNNIIVLLHDKKFSRRSIQWEYYTNTKNIYIAIEKLSNLNIIKNINI